MTSATMPILHAAKAARRPRFRLWPDRTIAHASRIILAPRRPAIGNGSITPLKHANRVDTSDNLRTRSRERIASE